MERAWVQESAGWAPIATTRVGERLAGRRPDAVWVHVDDHTDLPAAARRLGATDDVMAAVDRLNARLRPERAHLERLPDDGLYLVVPTLRYVEDTRDVLTGRVSCLMTATLVITSEDGATNVLDAVLDRLDGPAVVPERGTRQVLAALLTSVVVGAADVEQSLGDAVTAAEQLVFSPVVTDPLERVYELKREIAEARRALAPLASEIPELVASEEDVRGAGPVEHWLPRLQTAVDRIDGRLSSHDRLLGDMLSVHLAQVSVRQNEDMRKISAWAAIAAAPTLLAGVWGMNFQHMPELTWGYGYGVAVATMVAVCTGLYGLFKRSGWL